MKKLAKKQPYSLKDILDSDDELPTEYIEIPFVPAYQNDHRFEYIEEQKKINNKELINKQGKEEINGQTVIALGYLNKKDAYCFRCLETTASEKTLLWFLNFLLLKDLHSKFTFLTTCLVPRYDNVVTKTNSKSLKACNEKRHRYKVVASK